MAAPHMKVVGVWFLLPCVFLAGPPRALGEDKPPEPVPPLVLKAVPHADQLAAAERAIRDEFKAQYAKKGAADRAELAQLLQARLAERKSDDAVSYVLANEAANLLAAASDVPAAFGVLETLAQNYSVSALDLKLALWRDAWHKAAKVEEFERVFNAGLQLLGAMRDEERFDAAEKLAATLRGYMTSLRDPLLKGEADSQVSFAKTVESNRIAAALVRLKGDPKDRFASLTLAQYYAFTRNDWTRALPLFAQCSDAVFAEAAKKDLASPQDAAGRLQAGDAWWRAGLKEAGDPMAAFYGRAAEWYRQALADLPPAQKTTIEERLAKITKAQSGLVRTIKLGPDIRGVAMTPSGRAGLATSYPGGYGCFDLDTGKVLHGDKLPFGAMSSAFSSDGHCLAFAGGTEGEIRILDVLTGQLLKSAKEPTLGPKRMAMTFNKEGQLLVAAFTQPGGEFVIKNIHTGKTVTAGRKAASASRPCWNHDLSQLAVCAGGVHLIDAKSGALIRILGKEGIAQHGGGCSFSWDGRLVVFRGSKDCVHVLSVATGELVRTVRAKVDGNPLDLEGPIFLPDNRRIAMSCSDNSIRIWDFQADREVLKLECGKWLPVSPAVSPNGRFLLTGGRDGELWLFRLPR